MSDKEVRAYLAKIGAKGGKAKGKAKLRGGPDYYKAISAKAAAARKKKKRAVLPTGDGNG
jgi:hypothetical protein